MMATALRVESEQHWHALRARTIGASEVAALFNQSPWMTRYGLWHLKKGTVERPDFGDNERIFWGSKLEPVIAAGIAEKEGWDIRKVHRYLLHKSVPRMGASLDFEIINHPDGAGCFEVKNVDRSVFYENWWVNDRLEPPIHIELQLQHQLAVSGRNWGAVGALVGGNECHVVTRSRHETIISQIEKAVSDFWKSLDEDREPPVYDERDYDEVRRVFGLSVGGKEIDLTETNAASLCREIHRHSVTKKDAEQEERRLKAELLLLLGDAEAALVPGFKVSAKTVTKAEHIVKATTYRSLSVKRKKEKI